MKATIVVLGLVTTLVSFNAASQSNSPAGNLPPGLEKRNELPPGLQNRNQPPPGLAKRGTNDFNQDNDNNSTSSSENRSGSSSETLNQNSATRTTTTMDRALTQTDRTVLLHIRQLMRAASDSPGGTTVTTSIAALPVHFTVNNGIVEMVGVVPTLEDKQRVQAVVQRIPNVTGIIDHVEVKTESASTDNSSSSSNSITGGSQTSGSATNSTGLSTTNALTPTSTRSNATPNAASTNQLGTSTNLPPTSRTNSSGLPKADHL